MKRSERGFERVGHLFLSGGRPEGTAAPAASPMPTPPRQADADTVVPSVSRMRPAKSLETADAIRRPPAPTDHVDGSRGAEVPSRPCNAGHHLHRLNQACDCIGSTVARLEILKKSCHGVTLAAERSRDGALWFQGAAAIIQDAMTSLSAMIPPLCFREFCPDKRRDKTEDRT
jgi:hypothetical protein